MTTKKAPGILGNMKNYDLTNIDNYEKDYEIPFEDRIKQIYAMPGTDDMAGVFLRGIFKSERQANACLRLMYRHAKFEDSHHQELLRAKIASTAAIGGVSRLDALFSAIGLIASDMYRVARGMPKLKKGEEEKITRGSDFRQDGRPPEGGLGNK